jgi:hypothetical protein
MRAGLVLRSTTADSRQAEGVIVIRRTGVLLLALGATLIAGCTSSPSAGPGGQPTSSDTTASQPSTPTSTGAGPTGSTSSGSTGSGTPQGNAVTVGDADKGRTLTVAVGDQVVLTLASTYWRISDPTPVGLLVATGPPVVNATPPGGGTCIPGGGCGTVAVTFRASKPGTVTATASRTSCGEARGCVNGEGSYQVTIIVR